MEKTTQREKRREDNIHGRIEPNKVLEWDIIEYLPQQQYDTQHYYISRTRWCGKRRHFETHWADQVDAWARGQSTQTRLFRVAQLFSSVHWWVEKILNWMRLERLKLWWDEILGMKSDFPFFSNLRCTHSTHMRYPLLILILMLNADIGKQFAIWSRKCAISRGECWVFLLFFLLSADAMLLCVLKTHTKQREIRFTSLSRWFLEWPLKIYRTRPSAGGKVY